jgi:hypothetical protein
MATNDEAERKERAERLRKKIGSLKQGERPQPKSPRDFIEERMEELAEEDGGDKPSQ